MSQRNTYLKTNVFKFIPVIILMLFCKLGNASNEPVVLLPTVCDSIIILDSISLNSLEVVEIDNNRPNPVLHLFKSKQKKNKRITAAILAFPFPFGIVGLHRIYLGTSPHVPVVYIASLGGVFGILPFIDFCVIVLDKDLTRYTENKKVFMWVN